MRDSGSQTGSQQRQTLSDARRFPAIIAAAKCHNGRHQATSRDPSTVPSKQRVAGSNPAGRTHRKSQRQGTYNRGDNQRSRCARPPPCPLRARSPFPGPPQCVFRVLAQRICDGPLPLVAAMQVDHGRAGCRVPHAVHQLPQAGARIRGELVTGMAQIVKVNQREPGRPQSWPPCTNARG